MTRTTPGFHDRLRSPQEEAVDAYASEVLTCWRRKDEDTPRCRDQQGAPRSAQTRLNSPIAVPPMNFFEESEDYRPVTWIGGHPINVTYLLVGVHVITMVSMAFAKTS